MLRSHSNLVALLSLIHARVVNTERYEIIRLYMCPYFDVKIVIYERKEEKEEKYSKGKRERREKVERREEKLHQSMAIRGIVNHNKLGQNNILNPEEEDKR